MLHCIVLIGIFRDMMLRSQAVTLAIMDTLLTQSLVFSREITKRGLQLFVGVTMLVQWLGGLLHGMKKHKLLPTMIILTRRFIEGNKCLFDYATTRVFTILF